MSTPVKKPVPSCSQTSEIHRVSENFDPNIPISTPSKKPIKSPSIKSANSKKSAPKTPHRIVAPPPPPPARERKFIVAKKKSRRGEKDLDNKTCREKAYEALRASQEEFFQKDRRTEVTGEGSKDGAEKEKDQEITSEEIADHSRASRCTEIGESNDGGGKDLTVGNQENVGRSAMEDSGVQDLEGSSNARKMINLVMEEALDNIPEPGSGRVKHLVKAFESLLSISKEPEEAERVEERKQRVMNWALPGLQMNGLETEGSSSLIFSSVEFFPSKDFQRDSRLYSSMDGNGDRLSWGSRTSGGGRRSRRNSSASSDRSWNKKLKVTSQQPFKLRTEQRGRIKEENFLQKVKEMLMEEEKKRIPIAQGLPWTTDEPECLVKPPVKERTEPIDLVLHTDIRAVERSEFDQYVAERISFAEQIKQERERQRKLEEEEEIRRLRKELVPKAQPMPYFDRPFIPKKSSRPRTVAKEPRFRIRPMRSSCVSILGG